jgi:hypothetical protein
MTGVKITQWESVRFTQLPSIQQSESVSSIKETQE